MGHERDGGIGSYRPESTETNEVDIDGGRLDACLLPPVTLGENNREEIIFLSAC